MANTTSETLLDQAMNQFMHEHFNTHIPLEKIKDIQLIWDKMIDGNSSSITEEQMALIVQLNVTAEDQQDFLTSLQQKYETQWDEDATKYIQKQFNLSTITPNHVIKFGSVFNNVLEQLSKKLAEKSTPEISDRQALRDARIKFFTTPAPLDETASQKKDRPEGASF